MRLRKIGLLALLLAAITGALGVWQFQRLHWKQGLIADIAARAMTAPVDLPATLDDPVSWEFRRVRVRGHYESQTLWLNRPSPNEAKEPGSDLLAVLVREDGSKLVIDRGWVKLGTAHDAFPVTGEIERVGVVRVATQPNFFVPPNEPGAHRFFWVDPPAVVGGPTPPIWIALDPAQEQGPIASGGPRAADITNNHLQYLLTWFSLSAILLGIAVRDIVRS
ncbi:SURF1 family protein [Roseiterribacter gracilis]|uniref:SURF1-like protein n=1 Tax=Roseiterribacter gracilis TaxID=2812848 RepID=A0A8S8XHM5_9PROT|nr:SURF1-like protein [Rhodospirillales bacterium TMPK1]